MLYDRKPFTEPVIAPDANANPPITGSPLAERRAKVACIIADTCGWTSLPTSIERELATWTGDVTTTRQLFTLPELIKQLDRFAWSPTIHPQVVAEARRQVAAAGY